MEEVPLCWFDFTAIPEVGSAKPCISAQKLIYFPIFVK